MTNAKPKVIYQNHRNNQIERILDAAEALFIRDGIENVSMNAIARAARMSRKTLYQYFSDKREIAWAIYQKLVEEWEIALPAQSKDNGYQQLERFMAWVLSELETKREHQRFFVEFNTLYAREAAADHVHQMISPSGSGAKAWIVQIVRQGVADGSLRADLDPEMASIALLNVLIGMNARFATLGDFIAEEYGQPNRTIYQEICRVFLRGIQSKPQDPSPQNQHKDKGEP